jgi:hypothetical protein
MLRMKSLMRIPIPGNSFTKSGHVHGISFTKSILIRVPLYNIDLHADIVLQVLSFLKGFGLNVACVSFKIAAKM